MECTRDYQASDPREKLYALLGMASDVSFDDLPPDYAQPVEAVFRNLVSFMINARGSLDIISSGRLALATPGPPTWVPDWRVPDQLRPLQAEEVAGHLYRAAGNTVATIVAGIKGSSTTLILHDSTLAVEGVIADQVRFNALKPLL